MAGDLHKHVHEAEIKCPAEKFYNLFRYHITDIPKVMPHIYKSIEVVEGDGVSVGTSRLIKYVLGDDPTILTVKDRLEEVDDENMSLTLRVLEGDHILEHYKSFAFKLTVTPKGEGSLVTWCLEHEKKHETSPAPHGHVDLVDMLTGHCDGHLHKC